MLKVEIILNEDKILSEQQYNLQDMWNYLDDIYTETGIVKTNKGIYCGQGEKDFQTFWEINMNLFKNAQWFTENVLSWQWYGISADGEPETENILEEFIKAKAEIVV